MQDMNILYGIDYPQLQEAVEGHLVKAGYRVESATRITKSSIRDYLRANPSCTTVILLEVLKNPDGSIAKYTADELAMLNDENNLNIIVVLSENLRGQEYLSVLYNAGITSAILQSGNMGVSAEDIVNLCIRPRSRKEARRYYGISGKSTDMLGENSSLYAVAFEKLGNAEYGAKRMEIFLEIVSGMTYEQVSSFIKRIPDEMRNEFIQFEEFHMVVELLKEHGYDLKIQKPKVLEIGLYTPSEVYPRIMQNEQPVAQTKEEEPVNHMMNEDVSIRSLFEDEDENEELENETFESHSFNENANNTSTNRVFGANASQYSSPYREEPVEEPRNEYEERYMQESSVVETNGNVESTEVAASDKRSLPAIPIFLCMLVCSVCVYFILFFNGFIS